jgi:hypothetical protein
MYIVLKEYLARLSTIESRLPAEEQRQVPTYSELADIAGIHRVTFSHLVNNKTDSLNLNVASKIITEMRRRGFPMQETDLLIYRDPESA